MRILLLIALLPFATIEIASAQLSYLGKDELPKRSNAYDSRALAGGIVELGKDFYFTTPSGKLYRTDGAESGTKTVYTAKAQSMPILAATGKFLYIGLQEPGYASFMHRYTPASAELKPLSLQDPERNFRFNNNRVPGYNAMADALAVSPDRRFIAFRIFMNDALSLNVISDEAPEKVKLVKYCSPAEIAQQELSIYVQSDIAFVRNEIFVNGHERDLLTTASRPDAAGNLKLTRTGNRAFTAVSAIKKPGDATTWTLGSYYHLDARGYTLYEGLFQCGGELYALVSKSGGKVVGEHQLVRFDSTKLLLSNDKLPGGDYYRAEVHDDAIYLLTTGKIYRYDPARDKFLTAFSDTGSGWNPVFDTELMLKSGKYLLTRSRERLLLIDESTGSVSELRKGAPLEEPNRFSFGDRYAWATKRAFFVIDTSGGKPVLTRFSPATRGVKPIPMPAIGKDEFSRFRAIFQLGDRFLLLTEYRDRKGAPVYHMFMYRDEAS